jgi:hypothetical protein
MQSARAQSLLKLDSDPRERGTDAQNFTKLGPRGSILVLFFLGIVLKNYKTFIFKGSKIATLCISLETVNVGFFL